MAEAARSSLNFAIASGLWFVFRHCCGALGKIWIASASIASARPIAVNIPPEDETCAPTCTLAITAPPALSRAAELRHRSAGAARYHHAVQRPTEGRQLRARRRTPHVRAQRRQATGRRGPARRPTPPRGPFAHARRRGRIRARRSRRWYGAPTASAAAARVPGAAAAGRNAAGGETARRRTAGPSASCYQAASAVRTAAAGAAALCDGAIDADNHTVGAYGRTRAWVTPLPGEAQAGTAALSSRSTMSGRRWRRCWCYRRWTRRRPRRRRRSGVRVGDPSRLHGGALRWTRTGGELRFRGSSAPPRAADARAVARRAGAAAGPPPRARRRGAHRPREREHARGAAVAGGGCVSARSAAPPRPAGFCCWRSGPVLEWVRLHEVGK